MINGKGSSMSMEYQDAKTEQSARYKRIAIITGASSGIGEATARRLVNGGYSVIGNGRNQDKLNRLQMELGEAFQGIAGDAADPVIQDLLFEQAIEHFGREADAVIVNAGRGLGGAVSNADLIQFEEVVRTNLVGALSLMQKAAQKMIARLERCPFPEYSADIVVIGSTVGRQISPFSAVYGSTKFAVHSLVEGLRRELSIKGIRVSLVEPGMVLSGFQQGAGYSDSMVEGLKDKYGPLLQGDDIARGIEFILEQPPYVHVGDIVIRPVRQDYP